MAAVNSVQSNLHLPLAGLAPPRVLMCSASMGAEGSVTLQLREAVQAPDSATPLDTASLTIGYPDPEILADVLGTLQAAALNNNNNNNTTNCGNSNSVLNSNSNGLSLTTGNSGSVSINGAGGNSSSSSCSSTSSISSSQHQMNSTSATTVSNSNSNICSNNSSSGSSSNSNSSNSSSSSCSDSSVTVSHSQIVVKKPRPKTSSPTRHGPQQCQVCSKIFGNASALAKHKLTHSDERKYVCAMCSKAFKRQDHLNGHMLTHRNKKPYECKAEGCGKSYCDARSLRRHTENHHSSLAMTPTTPNQSMSPSTGPPTGLSLSPATASGDASSPHGATCIQYINNGDITNSKPSSPSSPAGAGNEGLTRQQLDLISQIMQQTKQASAQITVATNAIGLKNHHQQQQPRPRTWNMQTQLQQTQTKSPTSIESVTTATITTTSVNHHSQRHQQHQHPVQQQHTNIQHQVTTQTQQQQILQQSLQTQQQQQQPHATHALNIVKVDQKPVECNLCHRKFKNIPALNGHMRLHGGYFKKDTETKKCEKKETPGPPLQTASIGVRALIEEKIISKRSKDLKGAFVVPAPPLASVRRICEAEGFLTPKTPTLIGTSTNSPSGTITSISQTVTTAALGTSLQVQKHSLHHITNASVATSTNNAPTETKDATLIELLKRGTKVAVKRTCSDPGQVVDADATSTVILPSDPSLSAPATPIATPPLAISLAGDTTPLSLTISQAPNGTGDVFTLAYSTDSSTTFFGDNDVYSVSDTAMLLQAVDSIQLLNDSTAADQLDEIASLSDYSLGAGGDSSAMSETPNLTREFTPSSKQLQAVLNSPLPESLAEFSALHSKDYILYNCTSNTSPATHSSVSPLPSPLAYPTPPASHEAVAQASPFLDDSHHFSDANSFFDEKTNTNFMDDNNGSQLFKSTNDADLTEDEKILKLKNELFNESKSVLEDSERFFKTEDSSTDVFDSQVKVEDLLNENNNEQCDLKDFNHQNLSFLDEAQSFLDDPRPSSPLSASFFSSAITTAEEVKEALKDVLPGDSLNTENHCDTDIDLYYLPGLTLQSQMMPNSDDPLLSSSPKDFVQRTQLQQQQQQQQLQQPHQQHSNSQQQQQIVKYEASVHPNSFNPPNSKKSRTNDDVLATPTAQPNTFSKENTEHFLNPPITNNSNTVSFVNVRTNQSQLQINSILKKRLRQDTAKKSETYRSKLRRPSTTHYTPAPILNPDRKAPGLYSVLPKTLLQEATLDLEDEFEDNTSLVAFLDDSKVNIGTAYQATIPSLATRTNLDVSQYEEQMWDPSIAHDDKLLTRFIELSKSSAVPLGFHSEEVALKALLETKGETHIAVLSLLQAPSSSVHLKWSSIELESFLKGLERYGKDFYRISREISTKTTSECIQMYYFWKKLCVDYKITHLKQDPSEIEDQIQSNSSNSHSNEIRPHVCEMPDCSASFTSKAALHGHTRIHCIGRSMSQQNGNGQNVGSFTTSTHGQAIKDDFPCKVCGK